jgi:hypothetical protein
MQYALYAGGGWSENNNHTDPFVYVLATQKFETDEIKTQGTPPSIHLQGTPPRYTSKVHLQGTPKISRQFFQFFPGLSYSTQDISANCDQACMLRMVQLIDSGIRV